MLGNGTLGSLIYGDKNLKFALDLVSLWDERPEKEIDESFTYQNMVDWMRTDWNRYLEKFDRSYSHPYPSKINAGTLFFERAVLGEDEFDLDLAEAKLDFRSAQGNISALIFAQSPVMMIDMPKDEKYIFLPPPYLNKSEEEGGLGYQEGEILSDGDFKVFRQPMYGKQNYYVLFYEKISGDRKHLFINISLGEESVLHAGKAQILKVANHEKDSLADHRRYWNAYDAASFVSLPEEKMMDLYDKCRYFFACNSHGDYPMSLQGVWTKNDGHLPPWHGDYHNDINLEMSYESYLKSGNFKEGKVLCDYLWERRQVWREFSQKFACCDGYLIPGVMSQGGIPLGGWPMYALNPNCGIWLAKCFDDYYRYTLDRRFLKERAFPFLAGLEKSIYHLLHEDEEGYLTYGWSASPEMNDCTPAAILGQSNWELSLLHYLYKTLIFFGKELGKDTKDYETKEGKLRPYWKDEEGNMLIAPGLPYDVSHRHFSHLLMEKNLGLLNPIHDKAQLEKDIGVLQKYGTDQWVGFSFTEMAQFCAYALNSEAAIPYLRAFEDGFVSPNGFHLNMDYQHKGYSSISSPAFTLEANMGYIKAVNDLCLYSHDNVVAIFPKIPEEWKEKGISFRLFGEGAISVKGKYEQSHLSFGIESKKPSTILLWNNIGTHFSLLVDGKAKSFEAKIGETVEISFRRSVQYSSI